MKLLLKSPDFAGTEVLFLSESDCKKPSKNLVFGKELQAVLKKSLFSGKEKSQLFLPFFSPENQHLLLVGTGNSSPTNEDLRRLGAVVLKRLKNLPEEQARFRLDNLFKKEPEAKEGVQALAEGVLLANYECQMFKEKKSEKKESTKLKEIIFSTPFSKKASLQKAIEKGQILADACNVIKTISNTPGNLMTPSRLAERAQALTRNTRVKTTVWNKARIKKEKMGGLLGVSLGSSEEPRFIIMEYKGGSAKDKPVCLVGKGLTFDSGGISLKPAPSMDDMKFDMCGAAAVLGAMVAIEKLKLKVNVLGLIPSSENMPGQSANKPGDILTARNGKTMEVLNTDAEGRLILADALSFASEQKPQAIFDAATLTGAVIMALGNIFTGFFTQNEKLVKKIQDASDKTGERVWRLPLVKEHTKDIESKLATVANISSTRGAGSSTAAAFLQHFVEPSIPWAHFDIAGTAWSVANRLDYCSPKLASGVMVRTFVEIVSSFQKKK